MYYHLFYAANIHLKMSIKILISSFKEISTNKIKIKSGYKVPKIHYESEMLDKINGNTLCSEEENRDIDNFY